MRPLPRIHLTAHPVGTLLVGALLLALLSGTLATPVVAQDVASGVATPLGTLSADGERVTYALAHTGERTVSRDLLALGPFGPPEAHDADNVRLLLTAAERGGQPFTPPPLAADTLLATLAEVQAAADSVAALVVAKDERIAELEALVAETEGLPEQLATCQAAVSDLTQQSILANENASAALQTLRNAISQE